MTLGPLIWTGDLFLQGFGVGGIGWVVQHILVVLVVSFCVVLVRRCFTAPAVAYGEAPPPAPPRPAFLVQMPEAPRGRLMRVSADDHYHHIFTTRGEARILMRFRDAMVELADPSGHHIHGSHWVAQDALIRIRGEGRQHVAELS